MKMNPPHKSHINFPHIFFPTIKIRSKQHQHPNNYKTLEKKQRLKTTPTMPTSKQVPDLIKQYYSRLNQQNKQRYQPLSVSINLNKSSEVQNSIRQNKQQKLSKAKFNTLDDMQHYRQPHRQLQRYIHRNMDLKKQPLVIENEQITHKVKKYHHSKSMGNSIPNSGDHPQKIQNQRNQLSINDPQMLNKPMVINQLTKKDDAVEKIIQKIKLEQYAASQHIHEKRYRMRNIKSQLIEQVNPENQKTLSPWLIRSETINDPEIINQANSLKLP